VSNVTGSQGAAILTPPASAASFSLCTAWQCQSSSLAHTASMLTAQKAHGLRPSSVWSTVLGYDAAFLLVMLSTSIVEEQGPAAATFLSIAAQVRQNIAMLHVFEDAYFFANAEH